MSRGGGTAYIKPDSESSIELQALVNTVKYCLGDLTEEVALQLHKQLGGQALSPDC